MKGGLSSRNVVFKVGEYERSAHSSISGPSGQVTDLYREQGRDLPAKIIEHQVWLPETLEICSSQPV